VSHESANQRTPLLAVNDIKIVYQGIILALDGVTLQVPAGGIVALLGANGAGKTTALKAISNLLCVDRGEIAAGSIVFDGKRIDSLWPSEIVKSGCIQVMEGRRCFRTSPFAKTC
jgi:branched-chain amino acid transport system ATP-binding protein